MDTPEQMIAWIIEAARQQQVADFQGPKIARAARGRAEEYRALATAAAGKIATREARIRGLMRK